MLTCTAHICLLYKGTDVYSFRMKYNIIHSVFLIVFSSPCVLSLKTQYHHLNSLPLSLSLSLSRRSLLPPPPLLSLYLLSLCLFNAPFWKTLPLSTTITILFLALFWRALFITISTSPLSLSVFILSLSLFYGLFGLREGGKVERSKVNLVKNMLILGQFYFTLLF